MNIDRIIKIKLIEDIAAETDLNYNAAFLHQHVKVISKKFYSKRS